MKRNSITLKSKTTLCLIGIMTCLLLSSLSCKAQILINDSTVNIGLKQYREVRTRLILADSLITSTRYELKLTLLKMEAIETKSSGIRQINVITSKQLTELNEQNKLLIERLNESTKTKWYRRPEIYLVSGIIIGLLIN